jgi:hypothetical protein
VKHNLAPPIDNEGIDVVFCGLAVTTGRVIKSSDRKIGRVLPRDPGRENRLQLVWRSLFTTRELVRFEPYCSTLSDIGTPENSELSNKGVQQDQRK